MILIEISLAGTYRSQISTFVDIYNDSAFFGKAVEILRSPVLSCRFSGSGHLRQRKIEPLNNLAKSSICLSPETTKPRRFTGGASVRLVAGVGFEPTTFRL